MSVVCSRWNDLSLICGSPSTYLRRERTILRCEKRKKFRFVIIIINRRDDQNFPSIVAFHLRRCDNQMISYLFFERCHPWIDLDCSLRATSLSWRRRKWMFQATTQELLIQISSFDKFNDFCCSLLNITGWDMSERECRWKRGCQFYSSMVKLTSRPLDSSVVESCCLIREEPKCFLMLGMHRFRLESTRTGVGYILHTFYMFFE